MFRRALFASDLSDASDLALECVSGWRSLGLTLVTVAPVQSIAYAGGDGSSSWVRAESARR